MALNAQNEEVAWLTSTSRTTTQTSPDFSNLSGQALVVVLDMTTVGTGSVTLTINGKDTASGKYYLLLAGAAVITNDFPTTMSTPDVDKVVTAVGKLQTSLKPLKQDNTDIVAALHSLEQKMAELPTALSPKEAVEVSNLNELKDQLATLISAVQANNKELPAPKVTVQPTPVTVQPTDTKGIVAALKAVQTEVRNKPVPGTPTIATDPLIAYQPADIDDAGTVQYFGFTQVGGAWYIRKYDTGASPKTLRFAFGQSNYTTAWTNRAAQTYAIWGN
jgi:hypothetical protein